MKKMKKNEEKEEKNCDKKAKKKTFTLWGY